MSNKIPEGSLIKQFLPADHSDVHTYMVETEDLKADDIQVAFWTDSPKWVDTLMNLRNSLVKLVGLNGGNKDVAALENCIRTGGTHNLASIAAKSGNETILKLEDSHLSAHISIHIATLAGNKKLVSATTLVHFHNRLGKFYFFVIKPFHHLVVKGMLGRAIKSSISKSPQNPQSPQIRHPK